MQDYETCHFVPWLKNYRFEDVHVDVAAKIARLSVQHVCIEIAFQCI